MNKTTFMAKPGQVERKWYVVDATDVPLGRLSAVVASVLRGKNKPTFTPHTDTGDFVIVINAEKVKLTGKKKQLIRSTTHSNHPGGLKQISAGELRSKNAVRLIEKSVKGMLPHNTLGRAQGMKLKVFVGLSTLTLHNNQKFLIFQDLSKERNNKVCHKHNMQVLDVVKTLLHAFALFQELVKSLLTKKDVEEYIHTLTFVLLSTNHLQLLQL